MEILTTAMFSNKISSRVYSFTIAVILFLFSEQLIYAQISKKSKSDRVLITHIQNTTEDTVTIRGIVRTFSDSTALSGVRVVVKGGLVFTETDSLGRFELTSINVSSIDSLEFSLQGFLNEKRIWKLEEMNIYMDSIAVPLTGRIGCLVSYRWWTPRSIWWKLKNVFKRK